MASGAVAVWRGAEGGRMAAEGQLAVMGPQGGHRAAQQGTAVSLSRERTMGGEAAQPSPSAGRQSVWEEAGAACGVLERSCGQRGEMRKREEGPAEARG